MRAISNSDLNGFQNEDGNAAGLFHQSAVSANQSLTGPALFKTFTGLP